MLEYLEEENGILRRPSIYVTAPLLQIPTLHQCTDKGYSRDTFESTKDGNFGARALVTSRMMVRNLLETRPTLLLSLSQRVTSGTHGSIKEGSVQGRPLLVSNIKGNREGVPGRCVRRHWTRGGARRYLVT